MDFKTSPKTIPHCVQCVPPWIKFRCTKAFSLHLNTIIRKTKKRTLILLNGVKKHAKCKTNIEMNNNPRPDRTQQMAPLAVHRTTARWYFHQWRFHQQKSPKLPWTRISSFIKQANFLLIFKNIGEVSTLPTKGENTPSYPCQMSHLGIGIVCMLIH